LLSTLSILSTLPDLTLLIELYEIIDVFFVIIDEHVVHDFEGQIRKLFLTNFVFYF
jgi:hypothetical protein